MKNDMLLTSARIKKTNNGVVTKFTLEDAVTFYSLEVELDEFDRTTGKVTIFDNCYTWSWCFLDLKNNSISDYFCMYDLKYLAQRLRTIIHPTIGGSDKEWWISIPKQPNPEYSNLGLAISAVQLALEKATVLEYLLSDTKDRQPVYNSWNIDKGYYDSAGNLDLNLDGLDIF